MKRLNYLWKYLQLFCLIMMNGSTHSGVITQVCGGVGRNINEALQRFHHTPIFLSAIGNDVLSEFIKTRFPKIAKEIRIVDGVPTATYGAILDHKGECMFGIGDMKMHEMITTDYVGAYQNIIKSAPLVVVDGNIPLETMSYVLEMCLENHIPVWFEPTDINKASVPFKTKYWRAISYVSPNANELEILHRAITKSTAENVIKSEDSLPSLLDKCVELALPLIEYIDTVLITLSQNGILIVRNVPHDTEYPLGSTKRDKKIQMKPSAVHYPALPRRNKLISVSGSGDCLAAAFIAGVLRNASSHRCAAMALRAATQSLSSTYCVPDTLELDDQNHKTTRKTVIF